MDLVLLLSGFAFAGTVLLTGWVRRYTIRHSLLDVPNHRSSHSVPTPRGGGIGIAAAWLLAVAAIGWTGRLDARLALALAGGGALMSLVGWRDDRVGLSARTRLAFQFLAATWVVGWMGGVPILSLGDQQVAVGWAGALLAVLGMVWLINLYNFMDGIDGIAGVEALTAGAAIAWILWTSGAVGLALAATALAAAAAGFLVWNWPPARIFMGDVGSCLLGFAFGAIVVAAERTGAAAGLVLVVPLLVFVCDATSTLIRRLLRGERVYEAHRSHLYQRLVQRGWRHGQVSGLVAVVNLVLGAIAVALHRHPAWALPGTIGAIAGVLVLGAVLEVASRRGGAGRRVPASPSAGGMKPAHE